MVLFMPPYFSRRMPNQYCKIKTWRKSSSYMASFNVFIIRLEMDKCVKTYFHYAPTQPFKITWNKVEVVNIWSIFCPKYMKDNLFTYTSIDLEFEKIILYNSYQQFFYQLWTFPNNTICLGNWPQWAVFVQCTMPHHKMYEKWFWFVCGITTKCSIIIYIPVMYLPALHDVWSWYVLGIKFYLYTLNVDVDGCS